MMRAVYSFFWYLALPLVLARLWWRGRMEPGYRQHVAERLGWYRNTMHAKPGGQVLWLHAVSVGETRAAQPLIESLLHTYPTCTILLTHMTPTGRATGHDLFAAHAGRLLQAYLPYDTGWFVRRFLRYFSPKICILMETEVWPNLIAQCARQQIPVALVNARLSPRSLSKGERLGGLMGEAARNLSCVAAQTEADAARIRQLGAPRVVVTGSIKFDVTPPASALALGAALRAQIGARAVLLCASTREGEEEMILDALGTLTGDGGTLPLLLLVPRHPQRFDAVAQMAALRGMALLRRSSLVLDGSVTGLTGVIGPEVRLLLGDSMGEMFAYCAAADLAFIGGSLLPLGGQNLIEACAVGKPVLIGPHTFNFDMVTAEAIAADAALRVEDATALMRQAQALLADDARRVQMGRNAQAFAAQHRGATTRTMALLADLLKAQPGGNGNGNGNDFS